MGFFPFFIDIEGRQGLIVGGGRVAARKVKKLMPFGPELTVVAPVIVPQIREYEGLHLKERLFQDEDINGCTFVIAASDDQELNGHVSRLCKEAGVLVNVVDDKESCGFLFPALVKRGRLIAGISTEGASPQIAAFIRRKTEEELPDQMEFILDFLAGLREYAKESISDGELRGEFLKEAALLCLDKNRSLTKEEIQELLQGKEK